MGAFITLAIAGVLGACAAPTEFSNPLSAPGDVAVDEQFLGNWYIASDNEVAFLHIARADGGGALDVFASHYNRTRQGEVEFGWLRATAYPSTVNDRRYYNVRRVQGEGFDYTADGEEPGYFIVEATMPEADLLRIAFTSWTTMEKLIEGGKIPGRELKGTLPAGQGWDTPGYYFVDLSQQELRALFNEIEHQRMFDGNGGTFRRLENSGTD